MFVLPRTNCNLLPVSMAARAEYNIVDTIIKILLEALVGVIDAVKPESANVFVPL